MICFFTKNRDYCLALPPRTAIAVIATVLVMRAVLDAIPSIIHYENLNV